MKKKREIFQYIKSALLFLLMILCITGCGRISDGEYAASVVLTGGSGRAYVQSPCKVTMSGGKASAHIIWSSENYDYMIVDGIKYYPVNSEGNSEFDIPVTLDKDMEIQADTVAMSTPHLIDYVLRITIIEDNEIEAEGSEENIADTGAELTEDLTSDDMTAPQIEGLEYLSTDETDYATCFKIHRYSGGCAVICVNDKRKYLIIPETLKDDDKEKLLGTIPKDIVILRKPLDRIYLAASGVMCQFDALSAIDNILLSGVQRDSWYIESAVRAMDEGKLIYGGKYSAPDYERMVSEDINLAIENTMILHVPKVQEKIEQLGIPVFIDRSSYEPSPVGRCEWIKVYGLLTGKEKEASMAYDEEKKRVDSLKDIEVSDKTVVIFSVNSNHQIVTRKKNDYLAKMIEMAGGTYLAPDASEDNRSNSQMTISIEDFYDYAGDADILIYNATIVEAPDDLSSLMDLDVTFPNFKAIKNGKVWYTDKALYQYSDKTGTIISNLHDIILEDKKETEFFHILK